MPESQVAPADVMPRPRDAEPETASSSAADQVSPSAPERPVTTAAADEPPPAAADRPAAPTEPPPSGPVAEGSGKPAADGPGKAAIRGIEESLGHYLGLLTAAVAIALLTGLYAGDLLSSQGDVARGVVVAGVPIGGLGTAEARQTLRAVLEPRSTRPVEVRAGELSRQLDPRTAGLRIDWEATLERAATQPRNPITRVTSFFTERELSVVNDTDEGRLSAALGQLAPLVERAPTEGAVRFAGLEPVAVDPVAGQRLDLPAAARTVQRDWLSGGPVTLPLVDIPAATSPDDVREAIDDVARPAVSAPVTITGEGAQATLTPEVIASALTFRIDPSADDALVPVINTQIVINAVRPQLAATERPGRNASVNFAGGTPAVVPSQDGRSIDYRVTLANLLDVLTSTDEPRTLNAAYVDQPAKVTTAEINRLLSAGEISSFTTGGFAADSGKNIRRAAEAINGSVVAPGETFSLNAATNPRDAANGYVPAGIIKDGRPSRGIGGGVSQVATTLYNAAYFAGMTDVEHQEHSYYISRYPVAREATVFFDVIDVKFRNDGPEPVLILTDWTPSSITVRFMGTKIYEVASTTGPRTDPTPAPTRSVSGSPCSASTGSPGFTATDTRTLRDLRTGEVRRETQTVVYEPAPTVVCE